MKAVKIILRILAFTCSFIVPILLLGVISPLVHGELGEGLTGLGYIAIALIIVVVAFKLFGKIYKMEKGWKRALFISIFPIALWFVIFLGIDYIQAILVSVCDYWLKVGVFIFIGRTLAIIEECLPDEAPIKETKEKNKESEAK